MFEQCGFESDPTDDDERSEESPEYSDQWSSDVEASMYGKIHHADQPSFQTVLDSDASVSPNDAKITNEAPCIVLPTESEIYPLSQKTTPNYSKQTSKDPLQCVFMEKKSSFSFVNKKSVKLPGTSDSSVSPKSDIHLTRGKSKKEVPRKLNNKTSTPLPGTKVRSYDPVFESSGDESSDEVVFVETSNYEKNNSSKKICEKQNSKIVTQRCSKIAKHMKKLHSTISLGGSSDSSDDVICLNSTSSSDDLMTNVSRNNSFLLRGYYSSNSDNSNESASGLSLSTYSTDSKNTSWHIDDADRINIRLDRKSRKRHYTCRRCKGRGHNEYDCSKADRPIKCYLCGGVHKSSECMKKVCGLCYSSGHDRNQCLYQMEAITCGHCKVPGHIASRCPDIWRRYHLTTSTEAIKKRSPEINLQQGQAYCYNCGLGGHFGYQCHKPRLCRASRPCLPYVISYKNPEKLMKTSSTPGSRSIEEKYLKKHIWKQSRTLSRFATKTKDFQRTPKCSSPPHSVSLNSNKKRKKNAKKKRNTDERYFLQQTS